MDKREGCRRAVESPTCSPRRTCPGGMDATCCVGTHHYGDWRRLSATSTDTMRAGGFVQLPRRSVGFHAAAAGTQRRLFGYCAERYVRAGPKRPRGEERMRVQQGSRRQKREKGLLGRSLRMTCGTVESAGRRRGDLVAAVFHPRQHQPGGLRWTSSTAAKAQSG